MIVPLSVFTQEVDGKCVIWIQKLDNQESTRSSQVIFGAFFLMNYQNYWQYDLTANTTYLGM
jgi:hypothetical protein